MKKNKIGIILSVILMMLLLIIILLIININNKSIFKKPEFDKNASNNIPSEIRYQDKIINITKNYSLYIEPEPIIKNNEIILNLISLKTNNVLIKVRILKNDIIVAESGLIKAGQYLKTVKLNKKIDVNDEITYLIMGYENDSYLSAGSIRLNTRIGE